MMKRNDQPPNTSTKTLQKHPAVEEHFVIIKVCNSLLAKKLLLSSSLITHHLESHLEHQKVRRKVDQKGHYFYSELQTGTLMVMKQVLQTVEMSSANRERKKIKHVSKLLRQK